MVDRFVCLAERNSRKMLLIELPQKVAAIGGKCGAITNAELYAVIFPRARRRFCWQGPSSTPTRQKLTET